MSCFDHIFLFLKNLTIVLKNNGIKEKIKTIVFIVSMPKPCSIVAMFILSRQGVTWGDIHIDNFICLCLGCKRDSQVDENEEFLYVILIPPEISTQSSPVIMVDKEINAVKKVKS